MEPNLDLTSVANTFTQNGYGNFAAALVLIQMVFIPLIIWVAKHYTSKNKQIIDLERNISKLQRDKEYEDLRLELANFKRDTNQKLEMLDKDTNHRIEELNNNFGTLSKTLTTLFVRIDSLFERINTMGADIEVIKRLSNYRINNP